MIRRGILSCLAWRKDRLKDITNERIKSNNRFSVRLTLCLLLVTFMLTSSITTTIVYASSPNSTSLSNSGSGSSTPSNDKSKINSRSDSSGSSGGSGTSSGGGSTAHCDRPGYPFCSNLGSAAGKGAPGTRCPPGHSKTFCKSYVAAAGSPATSPPGSPLQQGNTAHCDSTGYPSCYSLGYADGKNHPGTSCPGGHSENYCNGYGAGTGSSASNNNNTTRSLSLHADAIHCDQVALNAYHDQIRKYNWDLAAGMTLETYKRVLAIKDDLSTATNSSSLEEVVPISDGGEGVDEGYASITEYPPSC